MLGWGQIHVGDATESSPTSLWGQSVEKPAQGGSTGTFGCVAAPLHLSPISLWDLSTTKERHRGVCSSLGCPSSAGRWPSCFQVGAQRAKAKPPAPAPGVPAVDPPPGRLHTAGVQQLDTEELVLAPGQAFFFF